MTALLTELSELQWDNVCFSETLAASGDVTLLGGHRLISHLGRQYAVVAFLMHACLADKVVAKREFGERVLGIRLNADRAKVSVLSVYLPHAGYSVSYLRQVYNDFLDALSWASSYSQCFISAGDLNTQLHHGANDLYDEQTWNDKWTFKSSLGIKRQIDFILAGLGIHVCQSRAVDSLDLGSDHRAVYAETAHRILSFTNSALRRKNPSRTWKTPEGYQQHMNDILRSSQPRTASQLESCITEIACDTDQVGAEEPSPKYSRDLLLLMQARRTCTLKRERNRLSKCIQKESRGKLRVGSRSARRPNWSSFQTRQSCILYIKCRLCALALTQRLHLRCRSFCQIYFNLRAVAYK